jgi:glycosyltransferase involved in cell wall biosynthesis
MKLTIVVTCFNEKTTILKAIEEVKNLSLDKEIIVVDNCSTDGSREILKALNDSSIRIVFQPQNYGYGQSVRTGASLAKGEFIYVQYADLEYGIGAVYEMLALVEKENLDAIFGSRLYGIKKNIVSIYKLIKERPYYLGTLITTFLINFFYGRKFTDIIGTRLYKTSSFRKIDIESGGIAFDFEVVSKLCKKGFRIKEVPVSYKARSAKQGKKVKALDIVPAIKAIFKVKFLG